MVSEVAWGDGTGGKIYLTYSASEGNQTVVVTSDANTGAARSKVVTFSASGVTPVTLTVSQEAAPSNLVSIIYNGICITYDDTAIGYPCGYKAVQYLSCNGKSAIDTGIVVAATDEIGIDYQLHSLSQTGDKYLYSCQAGYSGGGIWFETYGNANKWYVRFGSSSSSSVTNATYTSGRHTAIMKKQSCKIDGNTLVNPNYSSMPSTSLNFGGRINSAGTDVTGFFGYIYECWIKDSDGNFRYHGVPVVRLSDNTPGLLDTVTWEFKESVKDAFVAGADATDANE